MAFAYRAQSSAYMSIYNDWDILRDALESVVPYVSEIVFVDGAYEWMRPYLDAIGQPMERSDARGQAVIVAFAAAHDVTIRTIERVWATEIDKRIAGFEACAGRYVFRIDADEIIDFDKAALDQFFAEGWAIGEMEMPICVAPGLILAPADESKLPRQCFLFDRKIISAPLHLHYLWLILGPEPLPEIGSEHIPVFPTPLAFNTHLTIWRTPDTAVTRAAFYFLNYSRQHGHPDVTAEGEEPITDLGVLFANHVDPRKYKDFLLTSQLIVNLECRPSDIVVPAPRVPDEERVQRLYDRFLGSLAALNQSTVTAGRQFVNGNRIFFDLSTAAARKALGPAGTITLKISALPVVAKAEVEILSRTAPFRQSIMLEPVLEDHQVQLTYDDTPPGDEVLRQVLRLQIWCAPSKEMHRLRAVAAVDA